MILRKCIVPHAFSWHTRKNDRLPGTTKKDVEIGLVEEISLSRDLTRVIVKAQLVRELQSLTAELHTRTTPEVTATLQQAQRLLAAAESSLAADSSQQYRVKAALDDISGAARALRVLSEFLETHPESLLSGKGSEK